MKGPSNFLALMIMKQPKEPPVGVVCVECGQKIVVNKDYGITQEFSVKCPKCGKRAFYKIESFRPIKAP
jgi:DNA-directed RNA polymerase subunit RPC12/RpoP